MPFLPLVDAAVVSADFCPPLFECPKTHGVAEFLCSFGITRMVHARSLEPVEWTWGKGQGTTTVDEVEALSTLGTSDVFHGAFAWALGILHEEGRKILEDPSRFIVFATRIASVSTGIFGARSWRDDPQTVEAVEEFLSLSEVEDLRRGPAPR